MNINCGQTVDKIAGVLTTSEVRITKLRLSGKSQAQIAYILNLSDTTVHTHLENIYEKTECHSVIDLMHWYFAEVLCMNLQNYLV